MSNPARADEEPNFGPRRPALTRWVPRRWELRYDQIVILSTLGKSHDELALQFNYSKQQISNIVNAPQAEITRARIYAELQKRAEENIPMRLEKLADKSLERLSTILHDDDLFKQAPFGVVDRGLQVLKGIGRIKTETEQRSSDKNIQQNNFFLTPESVSQLTAAIKIADEARRLNAPKVIDAAEIIQDDRTDK